MKKILVVKSKHQTFYYDISTDEDQNAAYLDLFKFFDSDCEYYEELKEKTFKQEQKRWLKKIKELQLLSNQKLPESVLNFVKRELENCELYLKQFGDQPRLYKLAKSGNAKAARILIQIRSEYEYENVEEYDRALENFKKENEKII